jgi:hypothetical protein
MARTDASAVASGCCFHRRQPSSSAALKRYSIQKVWFSSFQKTGNSKLAK